MCNRTDCAGSWAGPMACAVCRERDMEKMGCTLEDQQDCPKYPWTIHMNCCPTCEHYGAVIVNDNAKESAQ